MWVFGYGSLVWRPDFPFVEQVPGFIEGYARRFWQGSPDHRGVPDQPGRVVTLVPTPNAKCWGMAYRIEGEAKAEVLAHLDHREQPGYTRINLDVHGRQVPPIRALVYFAAPQNSAWLGPESVEAIARRAQTAVGMSGTNAEYVLRLAEALRTLNVDDDHVFAVEAALCQLMVETK